MARAVNTITTQVDNQQAYRELRRLREEVSGVSASFARLQGAVAGIGIASFITQTLNASARVAELARSTGLTAESIAAFQLAISRSGATAEQAQDAIASLVKKIGEARAGSTEAVGAFGAIGITMNDLANLDSQEIFQRTLDGLKNIPDQARRNAAAIKLMEEAVKRVDFGNLNLGQFSQQAATMASTGENVRQAQINMANSLEVIKGKILEIAAPIVAFIARLTELDKTTQKIVDGVVDVAKVAGAFALLVPIFRLISGAATGLAAAAVAIREFGVRIVGLFRVLNNPAALEALIANLRMLPGVGKVAAAMFEALGGSITFVMNNAKTLAAAFGGVLAVMAKMVGINPGDIFGDEAEKETQNVQKSVAAMEAMLARRRQEREAQKKQKEGAQQLLDVQRQQQAAAQEQVIAFRRSIETAQRAFKAETQMIGLGEESRLKLQQQTEATNRYRDAMANLEQQIRKAQAAPKGSAEQQGLGVLLGTQKQLTAEYQKELGAIDENVKSRVIMERLERSRLFTAQQALANEDRRFSILDEAARVGLPLAQRQREEARSAADAVARQQIAAEQELRTKNQTKLTQEEINNIYAKAKAGVDKVIAAQEELNRSTERFNLTMFSREQQNNIDQQVQAIRDMTSTMGLGELERKFYDVDAAARAAARAAINMEEIRIGENLSPSRAKEYYDTALEGAQRLKAAMEENWQASRTFSAGWNAAFAEFRDTSTNAANVGRAAFENLKRWGEDFTNTLVDYFRTGQLEISKLVQNILADIARLTIQQTITTPIANALAAGLSGGFSGFGRGAPSAAGAPFQAPAGTGLGLRAPAGGANTFGAFANGGDAVAGRSYVVGERGREIFTPAVAGRVSPITQPQAPVLNLTVNVDARSDVAAVRQAVRESSYIAQAEMARAMRTGQR